MVLLFNVPCMLSVLLPVAPVAGLCMFSEKPPVTLPLKLPVRENAPVCGSSVGEAAIVGIKSKIGSRDAAVAVGCERRRECEYLGAALVG